MTVPVPSLDTLRFQQLVDDAKRLLPTLYPEWTDHNVSDPGIALLEACAQRVDRLSHWLDQVPDRSLRILLHHLDADPYPAQPAGIQLTLTSSNGVERLPEGTRLIDADHPVSWYTTSDVQVPVGGAAVSVKAIAVEYVNEVLGTSTGDAGQRFTPTRPLTLILEGPPDDPAGCAPELCVDADPWSRTDSFSNTKENNLVYVLDPSTGEISFAPDTPYTGRDGQVTPRRQGAIPEGNASIALGYWAVLPTPPQPTALTVENFADVVVAIVNGYEEPLPAETPDEALQRLALGLVPVHRAVTAADHETVLSQRLPAVTRTHSFLSDLSGQKLLPTAVAYTESIMGEDNGSHPGVARLRVRPDRAGTVANAYLRFDTPRFSVGRAVLSLFCEHVSVEGSRVSARAAGNDDWDAADLSSANEPGGKGDWVTASVRNCESVELDITSIVQESVAVGRKTFSVQVGGDPEAGADFEATFTAGPGAGSPELLVSSGADLTVVVIPSDQVPAACLELEAVRLLGARILVKEPVQQPVSVHVHAQLWVDSQDFDGVDAAEKAIEATVRGYLHELTGGDEGTGWPFGKPLRVADLYRLLETHPDIRVLDDVTLIDGAGAVQEVPLGEDTLPVLVTLMLYSKTLQVTVEATGRDSKVVTATISGLGVGESVTVDFDAEGGHTATPEIANDQGVATAEHTYDAFGTYLVRVTSTADPQTERTGEATYTAGA
ncbi:hypothetical protein [Streptomyces sp. NPDC092307]|uniref:CBM96 family carbohydrate-binding protein n=1 Tax=Streptomyces sp. NPDC092307 TaxID=3366013 RepID=UPI00381A6FAC